MDNLVAVVIDDAGAQRRVTGYAARAKNRARVWTFTVAAGDEHLTKEKVLQCEEARRLKEEQ